MTRRKDAYGNRALKKQEANPRWALISIGDGESSERVEGRSARKRMLPRFGTVPAVPAFAIYSVLSFPSRGEERGRERRRDTVNSGDNPGVWPYYISRRGGGLLLGDIILTAAPPVHASLAHFSRRATERARERRLSCTRDNGFPGSRGSDRRPVHPTGQSRPRVNEFSPWMKPRRPIARLPRRSESARAARSRVFLAFFSRDFPATSALACTRPQTRDMGLEPSRDCGMRVDKFGVSSQHEQFTRINLKRMLIKYDSCNQSGIQIFFHQEIQINLLDERRIHNDRGRRYRILHYVLQ